MHRAGRGQALVELAIILVLVLPLLLAGAVDFGRAFSAWIDMGNMARAGAQAGSIGPLIGANDQTSIAAAMTNAAFDELSTDPSRQVIFGVAPTVTATVFTGGQCMVTAQVTYGFRPIIRVPPIPSTITLTRTVQMRMQYVPQNATCT